MKLALVCTQFVLLACVNAFNVLPDRHQNVKVAIALTQDDQKENLSRRAFVGAVGSLATGSLVLAGPKRVAAFDSSLSVADAIKTLDFSLPSYDSISSSKASVETVEGLAEKYVTPETPRGMPRKPKAEPKASSGGNPMSAVLPSMNKSNVKKPKAKPAPREAPKEKEEEGPVGVETMDLSLPSYSFNEGKEKSIFAL